MDFNSRKKEWEERSLQPLIRKFPERKSSFESPSGMPIPVFSEPQEVNYEEKLGFPGEFPFTRGIQPNMYRGRFWTMRQYAGYATAEASNERYRYLLAQGQSGISVAFDLPTQIGYDADESIAAGEVGKVGVSVCSIDDMEVLLRDMPLQKISTSMTINAPAAILLAMYIAVAKRRGIDSHLLRGTIQNDILKEYIARGTYIFPPQPSLRLITDIFQFCKENVPHWNTISISGYHIREAGANAVQEVAFSLSNAITYVEAAIQSGLAVDEFASQLSFFFNAHNNFLEEIAKYRAARRLWAEIMRDRFGAKDPKSMMLRFHTQTAGSTLTAQQPENNIVRVAIQALAAVLGGTQSLHTNSMDEALWLPTEKSVRIALRTQQIIANESGVADSADPLGGSYLIEAMTDDIASRALNYIRKIDGLGGSLAAIENGFMQQEIQESAYRYQKAIESKDQIVVGVNEYQTRENLSLERLAVDPTIEENQKSKLAQLRRSRDNQRANELLSHLETAVNSKENLMPLFIECVENHITLGEICGVLRRIWGEYEPAAWI